MIRRATGKIGTHIKKPFMFTTIYNRALKREKDINQEQGSTTLISASQSKEKLPEKDNSSTIKSPFFSERKKLVPETPVLSETKELVPEIPASMPTSTK
ncbi:MAG: hypothetical protein WA659_00070 [Candidatus Aquirickettsiella sp.]